MRRGSVSVTRMWHVILHVTTYAYQFNISNTQAVVNSKHYMNIYIEKLYILHRLCSETKRQTRSLDPYLTFHRDLQRHILQDALNSRSSAMSTLYWVPLIIITHLLWHLYWLKYSMDWKTTGELLEPSPNISLGLAVCQESHLGEWPWSTKHYYPLTKTKNAACRQLEWAREITGKRSGWFIMSKY